MDKCNVGWHYPCKSYDELSETGMARWGKLLQLLRPRSFELCPSARALHTGVLLLASSTAHDAT